MATDPLDQKAVLIEQLGIAVIACAQEGSQDLWLFVQAGDGWVQSSLYEIGEGVLVYRASLENLLEPLYALWEFDPPAKRWSGMVIEIHGKSFTSEFFFEGELPDEDAAVQARELLISQRFANFRVVYPQHPYD